MVLHVSKGGETLATAPLRTDVGLFARVSAQVCVEVTLFRERLGTACVRTHVRLGSSLAVTYITHTCVRWWIRSLPSRE